MKDWVNVIGFKEMLIVNNAVQNVLSDYWKKKG